MSALRHLAVTLIGAVAVWLTLEACAYLAATPTARALFVATIALSATVVAIFRIGRPA